MTSSRGRWGHGDWVLRDVLENVVFGVDTWAKVAKEDFWTNVGFGGMMKIMIPMILATKSQGVHYARNVQLHITNMLDKHLSINNKGSALVGIKTSNENIKSNHITTATSNVCIPSLVIVEWNVMIQLTWWTTHQTCRLAYVGIKKEPTTSGRMIILIIWWS